jgi:hypothetical protein
MPFPIQYSLIFIHLGVGIAVGIADGRTARVLFPAAQTFSLLHIFQTASETHPAPYPMGTGAFFPRLMRKGLES